jgi:hypothetical protein
MLKILGPRSRFEVEKFKEFGVCEIQLALKAMISSWTIA